MPASRSLIVSDKFEPDSRAQDYVLWKLPQIFWRRILFAGWLNVKVTRQVNLQYEVIEAAGGLLWRISGDHSEVALIHRARYDDWTLPKGKREPGESWMATALREVREETCCEVEPVSYAGCTSYLVRAIPKVVMFWNMRLLAEYPFEANDETDELRWTTAENALVLLTYPTERELLRATLPEDSRM